MNQKKMKMNDDVIRNKTCEGVGIGICHYPTSQIILDVAALLYLTKWVPVHENL
jgi:hypothetical protein